MLEDLTPEQWRRLDRLLEQALAVDAEHRPAFLAEACGDDAELRAELERLLQAVSSFPSLFDQDAASLAAPSWSDPDADGDEVGALVAERLGPYRVVREIGAGGMSRVYLAVRDDGEIERTVAIKVMAAGTGDRAEYERRFRAERQILASFDHPEIARVYDGGVTDHGLPYVVMEHVSGQPLTTYCDQRNLGLEERLRLFVEVCGAVQYAHQRLVVHRDLKPSNILVTDEGAVKLLDFGIAKLLDSAAPIAGAEFPATRTGLLLLTPEYAAPEQFRGGAVTTATDVYSLGVVLYGLLTGRRPFRLEGKTPSEMERMVVEEEPAKPSTRAAQSGGAGARSLPWPASRLVGDLDTVVLAALHKDPERRYSSPRALADELERFLAGEPVIARPVGALERLVRKVRRHRRSAAALAAALALLAVFGAVAVHARWTAGRRAATAQRFGQEVERIDATLQRTFMAPRHDVRPELEQVRSRMTAIEDEINRLDGASRAIGHYALGRGHLGMGEEEAARSHLERAWEAGYTEPRVAYALGMALTRLYRQALDDLRGVGTKELREQRQREIETELRQPAIRALEAAGGDAAESELVSAALEFCGGELEAATARLAELTRVAPWFYEADLLAGDIFVEMETVASREGRIEDAREAQEGALAAFERAVDVGRSDQRGHEGLCRLGEHVLWREFLGEQAGVEELREHALSACGRAIEVNPDRTLGHLRISFIERRWAEHQQRAGHDPRPFLETGMRHGRIAADLARPGDSRPWVALAGLHRVEGTYLASRGDDPTEPYAAAVAALEKAIEVEPRNAGAPVALCLAELYFGDYERRRGGDAESHFENAVAAGRRAVERVPDYFGGHANLGIAYEQIGILRRDRGADASEMFAAGEAAFRRALELNPEFVATPFNLGQLLVERAELELELGSDPTASVREAQPWLEQVLEAWPKLALAYTIQARGEALLARWAMARGEDPRESLAAAREWADRGTAIGSGDAEDLAHAARIYLLEAHWLQGRGAPPEEEIGEALELLDRGLEKNPNLATLHQLKAQALWLRARQVVARGGDPRSAIESGLEAAEEAAKRNRTAADTPLQVARLEALRASWLDRRGRDASGELAAARAAAERSLELRPGYRPAEELVQELNGRAGG